MGVTFIPFGILYKGVNNNKAAKAPSKQVTFYVHMIMFVDLIDLYKFHNFKIQVLSHD